MRARILVKGRVQGVGYRHFVWLQANSTSVCGLVRNRRDGSVEIFAEGDQDRIKDFVTSLKSEEGTVADVENVEVYQEGSESYRAPWKEYNHRFIIDKNVGE